MKLIYTAILALATTAIATPLVVARQEDVSYDKESDQLDALLTKIEGYTANINKTTDAAPANPDLVQQTAAAEKLSPDFAGITEALTSVTAVLSKRDVVASLLLEARGGKCSKDCLTIKIKKIVFEITCTLKKVIVKLGLSCVLVYLTPLIIALSGLIKSLDKVIDGLLFALKNILDDVLKGVAAGLLGLIIW